MTFLIVKALHIIAVVIWFAGLFYLPRLFVYHTQSDQAETRELFKTMERRLYRFIMNPAVAVVFILGFFLMFENHIAYRGQGWIHLKIALVFSLLGYHIFCGYYLRRFRDDKSVPSSKFFRYFNEYPSIILIIVVLLAVLKPF